MATITVATHATLSTERLDTDSPGLPLSLDSVSCFTTSPHWQSAGVGPSKVLQQRGYRCGGTRVGNAWLGRQSLACVRCCHNVQLCNGNVKYKRNGARLALHRGHGVHELRPGGTQRPPGNAGPASVPSGTRQVLAINEHFGVLHFDAVRLLLLLHGRQAVKGAGPAPATTGAPVTARRKAPRSPLTPHRTRAKQAALPMPSASTKGSTI